MTATSGWASGVDGGGKCAFACDGTDDYVTVPSAPAINVTGTAITLRAWINRTETSKYGLPLAKRGAGGQFQLYWAASGDGNPHKLVFTANSEATVVRSNTLNLTGWHDMVVSYDGANANFYLDGLPQGSPAATPNITSTALALVMGQDGAGTFGSQQYEDLRIYNRALSANEVWAMFNPQTRWDLRYQIGRKVWSFPGNALQQSLTLLGCGA